MNKKTMLIMIIVVSMAMLSFGQGRNRVHTFDVTTPVEVSGKIIKVETVKATTGGYGRYSGGIHLTIQQGDKQSVVHLGPAAYMNSNNWEFKEGEMVTVNAYNGTGNYSGQLFAADVTRNGKQLTLRDKDGFPMWRQSMNRRGQGKGKGRGGWKNNRNSF